MLELATNRLPKLRVIANLYEALHDNAIIYCTLKGNERHLRISMTGESDIDILFDESQKEKLEQILAILGFKKFEAIKPKQYRQILDFLALDGESGKVIHLHAHYRIPMGEPFLKDYQLDIEHHILSTRQLNDDFGTYCISPSFELILLYFTESLKIRHRDLMSIYLNGKGDVSPKAIYEYNWLRKRTTEDELELSLKQLFSDQINISMLLKGEFNRKRLLRLAPVLKQLFGKSSLYSPFRALTVRWTREIKISILRRLSRILPWPVLSLRFNPRGGVVVAVTGNDREGQSTITRMLKETFRKKIDVYTVDLEWRTHLVSGGNSSVHGHEVKAVSNSGWEIASLWKWIKCIILARKNSMKMRWAHVAKNKGALVICNHYIDDQFNGHFHTTSLVQSKSPIVRFLAGIETRYHTRARSYPSDIFFEVGPAKKHFHEGKEAATLNGFLSDKFKVMPVDGSEPLKRKVDTIRRETWNML